MAMADSGGFIDLRVGPGAQGIGDDSVWPSFTDVMTVIVMIFLMALVIMMLRNSELGRQLVTTTTAKEASFAESQHLVTQLNQLELKVYGLQESLVISVGERDSLRAQLLAELQRIQLLATNKVDLESQLATIITEREQLLQGTKQLEGLRDDAEKRAAALAASEAELNQNLAALGGQLDALQLRSSGEIETLNTANLSLTAQLQSLSDQLGQLRGVLLIEQAQRRELGIQLEARDQELSAKQEMLLQLQQLQQQAVQRYTEANAKVGQLNESIRQRQAENEALQQLTTTTKGRYRSLQEEYDALDAKYRTLARPARSPAGKYVVNVRITKAGTRYRFQLKEPAQSAPVDHTRANLHARLKHLKETRGRELYTRIIIPKDSQLSHDDAWRFTQGILLNYDYYYQEYPEALGAGGAAGEDK